MTTPCVCGMRPPAVRCARSQGIRFGSSACRFHPMATRSQVVEVWTRPCVCGMRPPAVRCARSQGIRRWSTSVSFSPDGNTLASASGREIRLWDATTGSPLRTLTGHTSSVWSVSFSPDGNTLASASWDDTVRLWDATTGSPLRTLTGHTDLGSTACRFHPMATRSQVEVMTTPCVCGMRPPAVRCARSQGIRIGSDSVSFSPDGNTLASASNGTTPCVCGMRPPAVRCARSQGIRIGSPACRFHPMATRSQVQVMDKTVRLWDATTGSPLRTLTGHTS